MCDICDGRTIEESFDRTRERIDDGRWQVLAVGYEEGVPPRWAYTVGLTELTGHPELVVTGRCCAGCAMRELNELAERIAAGDRWPIPTTNPIEVASGLAHLRAVLPGCWDTGWFAYWDEYYEHVGGAPPERTAALVLPSDCRSRFAWDPGAHMADFIGQRRLDRYDGPPEACIPSGGRRRGRT